MARSYAASAMAVYILSQEPSENFEPEAVVVKPRKVFAKKDLSRSALRTICSASPAPHDPRMFFSTTPGPAFPWMWPLIHNAT